MPNDNSEVLYKKLSEKGLYTKSYDEFKNQFSTPENQTLLFNKLNEKGLYTKSQEEFGQQFFGGLKKKDNGLLPDGGVASPDGSQRTLPGLETPLNQIEAIDEQQGLSPDQEKVSAMQEGRPMKQVEFKTPKTKEATINEYFQRKIAEDKELSDLSNSLKDKIESGEVDQADAINQITSAIADKYEKAYSAELGRAKELDKGKQQNPIESLARNLWDTMTKQLPKGYVDAMASAESDVIQESLDWLQKFEGRDDSERVSGMRELVPGVDPTVGAHKEYYQKKLEKAIPQIVESFQLSDKFEKALADENLVNTLREIKEPWDAVNYVFANVGQALGQIPASAVTGGLSTYIQEQGNSYMEAVNELAKQNGITPEEVVAQGLDKNSKTAASAIGAINTVLDLVGVGKVLKGVGGTGLKKSIIKNAGAALTEAVTEGTQSFVSQAGTDIGLGRKISPDFQNIIEEAVAGGVGGGGLSTVVSQTQKPSQEQVINERIKEIGIKSVVDPKIQTTKSGNTQVIIDPEVKATPEQIKELTKDGDDVIEQAQPNEIIEEYKVQEDGSVGVPIASIHLNNNIDLNQKNEIEDIFDKYSIDISFDPEGNAVTVLRDDTLIGKGTEEILKQTKEKDESIRKAINESAEFLGIAKSDVEVNGYAAKGWFQNVQPAEGQKPTDSVQEEINQPQENLNVEQSQSYVETTSPQTDATIPETEKVAQEAPKESGRKKSVLNRAYEGENADVVKKSIEKHGLTYEPESHVVARENAQNFIKDVGIENAVSAVRNNQVEDGAAAFVWAEAIDSIQDEIAKTTDPVKIAKLSDQQAQLISEFDIKARSGGRFISALQEVYKSSNFNYSAERQTQKYKEANNGVIPEEVAKKFTELEKQLADVNKSLQKAEQEVTKLKEDQEFIKIRDRFEADRGSRKAVVEKNKKKINDFFDSLKIDNDKGVANDITRVIGLNVWNGSIEVMRQATLAGYDIANVIQKGIDHIKANYKGKDFNEAEFTDAVEPKLRKIIPKDKKEAVTGKPRVEDGKLFIPESLIKKEVLDGAKDINDLTNRIHNQIKEELPDVTEREVRDAITKYGQTKNLSKDEISKKIREFKRIGRLISSLEDVRAKKRPLRSGLQRDAITDKERRMQQELKEAMKDLPVDDADLQKALKTSLDAIKTRLRNQITDLENQLKTGEKPARKRGISYDEEAKLLMDRRDKLKEAIKELEGPQEIPLQEKINRSEAALRRSIDDFTRRINENDLAAKTKPDQVTSDLLEALRKQRDELRATLKQMQDDAGVTEKARLENAKKTIRKNIQMYEDRIKNKDFAKKEKKELTPDDELTKLRAHRNAIKSEFDRLQYHNELKNRTRSEKIIDGLMEAWGLTRALRATGEFSFVFIQGGLLTLSHPKIAAKAFVTAMKHFSSPKAHEKWFNTVKSQEYYERAKAAKLAVTETDVKLTAREELYISGWANHLWNIAGTPLKLLGKNPYQIWKNINPINAVERAGVGYLNTLRLTRYLQGEEMLELQGKNFKDNLQDYKNMADVINTFSGRASLGAAERIAKPLSVIFFSPRNWASVIKQATPYAFYHFGKMGSKGEKWYKPSVAQKMAMGDYMRYVGVTGAIVSLIALSQDDEEDGWKVELNPTSSDFMKLRRGNTRVDPWGGRIQMITLQARLIMGSIKNSKGQHVKLGTPFKADTMGGLIRKMVERKFSPSMSIANKFLNKREKKIGGEYYNVDTYGNILTAEDQLINNLYPIYWETIKELHEDQPATVAGFLDVIAFFGIGTQTYSPEQSQKKQREMIKKLRANK